MLGKTWLENHLRLMHDGTCLDEGGELTKKVHMNLRQYGLYRVRHKSGSRAFGGELVEY